MRKSLVIILSSLFVPALGFSAAGCCTDVEKKYNSCVDRLAKAQASLKKFKQRSQRSQELSEALADAQANVKKLKDQNAYLTQRLEALGQKVGEVQSMSAAQRAEMEKRLAETKRQLEELRRKQAQAQTRLDKLRELLQKFASLIKSGKIKVAIRDGRMVVVLASKVLFDSGKTYIKPGGRKAIEEITHVLKSVTDRKFQVAGHTDNTPIRRGRYRTNWELSTARAVAVVKLMQKLGMPTLQLSAAGYGEFSPVKANDSAENRAENRRIEIVLQPKLDELPNLKGLFGPTS
jgi:chemotaxis protein MotB